MVFKYNNDGKGKSESHEIDISPELDARINEHISTQYGPEPLSAMHDMVKHIFELRDLLDAVCQELTAGEITVEGPYSKIPIIEYYTTNYHTGENTTHRMDEIISVLTNIVRYNED